MKIIANPAPALTLTETPPRPVSPAVASPVATPGASDLFEGPRAGEPPTTPLDDAKEHLLDAAEDAGRLALLPVDVALKATELGSYYFGLLKRTFAELGQAAKDVLVAAEKTAEQRK